MNAKLTIAALMLALTMAACAKKEEAPVETPPATEAPAETTPPTDAAPTAETPPASETPPATDVPPAAEGGAAPAPTTP